MDTDNGHQDTGCNMAKQRLRKRTNESWLRGKHTAWAASLTDERLEALIGVVGDLGTRVTGLLQFIDDAVRSQQALPWAYFHPRTLLLLTLIAEIPGRRSISPRYVSKRVMKQKINILDAPTGTAQWQAALEWP